jgi:uncharacterized protein YdhG (YjbR/CyaY superfamily)
VLALVRKTIPDGKPVISYGIPAFRLQRIFIYCAAFRHQIGIYPSVHGNTRHVQELKPYANAKGNPRFPLDAPLPLTLIGRVAKALAKQGAQPQDSRKQRNPAKQNAHAA